MMSVWVAGSRKIVVGQLLAEPIAGNAGGTALYRGLGRSVYDATRPSEADLFTITSVTSNSGVTLSTQ
jgi:hypothetical protein